MCHSVPGCLEGGPSPGKLSARAKPGWAPRAVQGRWWGQREALDARESAPAPLDVELGRVGELETPGWEEDAAGLSESV